MSKTYAQLQAEISALQTKADATRAREKAEVVARIKEAIAVYGITASDLGLSTTARATKQGAAKPTRRKRSGGEVKYRNASGGVWGGRGPRPQWLREAIAAGKSLSDFAV